MKKKLLSIAALVLCIIMLASCSTGVSVPYYILAMDNYTENVFDVYSAYKETIIYYKDGVKDFEYSVYVDKGSANKGNYSTTYYYNVCESYEGYTFYGYNQKLYSVTDGKTYAVIQADGKDYLQYVKDYEERAHLLDDGAKYQKYSKILDSGTEVSYYAKVTPLMAADLYHYGIKETDKIISKYILMENTDFYISVEYSIEHSDGTVDKIAERHFEYYETVEENETLFASLPTMDKTVNINIVGESGAIRSYTVPEGVYVGIFTGDKTAEYYMDAEFTIAFDPENTAAVEGLKIYEKIIKKF